jgi:putative endopeptidase
VTESSTAPALVFDDFDTSVRIQDDLYRHVNGGWMARTEIPADKPMTGSFVDLRDRAEAAVRDIITSIAADRSGGRVLGDDERKIADLYASFMDEEAIERAGAAPLADGLAGIDAVGSTEDLMRLLGRSARDGVGGLVSFEAESDPGDPTRYVMFVGQSGLGLPDEEYYREAGYAAIREAYREHIAASFRLAGLDDAAGQAEQVLTLETQIAAGHWDKVKCRDMRLMYNLRSLDDFVASAPELHWRAFMAGAEIRDATMAELVVAQPSFFPEVAGLLTAERLPTWRSWARWRLISALSPYLSSAFVDERFRFYGTVLFGTPQIKDRWKRGVALVEDALGEAVGKVYVKQHFSPTAKERMDVLVANLVEAYRRSITDLEWMTEETKEQALDKLSKFRPHIGFPSKWRDYSALEVAANDPWHSRARRSTARSG